MVSEFSKDLKKKLKNQLSKETKKELQREINEIIRERENKVFFRQEIITLICIFLIIILSLIISTSITNKSFLDLLDKVGTPVISFFALYAAIKAYLFQKKQLGIQEKQTVKQSIENQFFQLINLHNEIVNSMHSSKDKDSKSNEIKGRSYFREVYQKFVTYFNEDDSPNKNKYFSIMRRIDSEEQDQLYHYFRNMYQLFQCVYKNQDVLSEKDQKGYIEIINAQLTYYEKQLLFFNTKFYGSDGFFDILTHYDFFKDYDNNEYSFIISKFENEANKNKKMNYGQSEEWIQIN
ncbi:putative phage abortive infection protein [Priestia megaterium]|uniref:putative phage abortive infection protein n=1 Tax=Priestia megaterium TaxID=1404 RepID=UPI002D7FC3AC|nr:putative phage abortive infection protein [Priestia megaterium]MEB4870194.1 putative phage abortive infection protein [Priestia megaterium]